MKRLIPFGVLLLLTLFLSQDTLAQEQRFGAGLVAGLNAAQIQGDDMAKYNKVGVRAGIRGIARFTEKMELSVDILFSQRGSILEIFGDNSLPRRRVHLDYVEVPVMFTIKDWLDEDGFYKVHFMAGLAYGRLFRSEVEFFPVVEDQTELFQKNDLSLAAGASYFLSEHFGFSARYTRSLIPLFDISKNGSSYKQDLWGYFLSFEAVYLF
ncbi:MAG: PorT family protein [Saprospiraceae bacterium]|nr:PorT family protein [Saprospiraceae bacterium]MCB0627286.1 PorT family protein [Saprospiraceae bacterium]MCB0680700.1 PorT family protein [Saprospiraceae bacterium]